MLLERAQIGVMLQPLGVGEPQREGSLQAVQRLSGVLTERIEAGQVVVHRRIVGARAERMLGPVLGVPVLTDLSQRDGSHVEGPDVGGIELEVPADYLKGPAVRRVGLYPLTQRFEGGCQEGWRLIILRAHPARVLEMLGRLRHKPFGPAGTGIEVVRLEQSGREPDRRLKLGARLLEALAERQHMAA